jgi:hypothetical protein
MLSISFLPKPAFSRRHDCLQTRSRHPRIVMPNFALLCDWAIWTSGVIHGNPDQAPAIVYVRSEFDTLRWFFDNVLPQLDHPFALVTGSHDLPMPLGWQDQHELDWRSVVEHRPLRVWFTENRDLNHPKIHSITLGIPNPDLPSWIADVEQAPPVWTPELFRQAARWRAAERGPTVFGCWYSRVGHPSGTCPAGADERSIALEQFADEPFFCWFPPGLDHLDFLSEMRRHQFTICPHGGGLDPSPRLFEALLVGTIPIVRRNTMTSALEYLPVVIVDDWPEVTAERLDIWFSELGPRLLDTNLGYLMSNQYLLDRIRAELRATQEGVSGEPSC